MEAAPAFRDAEARAWNLVMAGKNETP